MAKRTKQKLGAVYIRAIKWSTLLIKSLCCLLVVTAYSLGQAAQPQDQAQASKLLALERMWNQAQLTHDADALQLLVGEHFIDTEWDGSVSNREEFLADIRDPQFKPSLMNNQEVRVDLYGTAAVVTGIYHAKGIFQGKPYDHAGRFTDTWIFADGKWKCVASHTSLLKKH